METYNIFAGHVEQDPLWREAHEDLISAEMRMKELAAESPGYYFIFCTATGTVVASLDTDSSGVDSTVRQNAV